MGSQSRCSRSESIRLARSSRLQHRPTNGHHAERRSGGSHRSEPGSGIHQRDRECAGIRCFHRYRDGRRRDKLSPQTGHRTPAERAKLPAAIVPRAGAVETSGEQGSMRQGVGNAISINGSRPTSNNYLLDGTSNTDTASKRLPLCCRWMRSRNSKNRLRPTRRVRLQRQPDQYH